MTYNEKKSLYESIMKDVAKIVKRQINESTDDLISTEDAQKIMNSENGLDGYEYIYDNDSMYTYFIKSRASLRPSYKIATCATDGKTIYYNPDWMSELSAQEQAFVILHNCAHIIMNHHANNFEENIALDRKVNRFLEDKFPEFIGMTVKLNGYI